MRTAQIGPDLRLVWRRIFILLHEKFLQFDWLRAVVFQLNLKYLHVKITTVVIVAPSGPNQSERSKFWLDQSESSIQPM